MKVSLIGIPNPEVCAIAAGMCYDAKNPWAALRDALKNGHESVIEHSNFSFMIEGVSRALLAQLTRHRIASFSVQSQRYVSMLGGFPYITPPKIQSLGETAVSVYNEQMTTISRWYDEWLTRLNEAYPEEKNEEDARFVLPNACCTKLVMTMNARELHHFFSLRTCNRAQWEIRRMADQMLMECKKAVPEFFAAAGPGCVRGHCPEGKRSCGKPRKELIS